MTQAEATAPWDPHGIPMARRSRSHGRPSSTSWLLSWWWPKRYSTTAPRPRAPACPRLCEVRSAAQGLSHVDRKETMRETYTSSIMYRWKNNTSNLPVASSCATTRSDQWFHSPIWVVQSLPGLFVDVCCALSLSVLLVGTEFPDLDCSGYGIMPDKAIVLIHLMMA